MHVCLIALSAYKPTLTLLISKFGVNLSDCTQLYTIFKNVVTNVALRVSIREILSSGVCLCVCRTDVVEISSSDDEDDIQVVASNDNDNVDEDSDGETETSGNHDNDALNQRDASGHVLVNIGHPANEPDIFLAPQIAAAVKPHQVCMSVATC